MADLNLVANILRRIVNDLAVFSDGRNIPEDTLDSFIVSLEFVYRELIVLDATSHLNEVQREATAMVRSSLSTMRSFHELWIIPEYGRCSQVHPVCTGLVGRPSIEISSQQLT